MKRDIDILDERRRNWFLELEQYQQAIHNVMNSLNFNNKQQQLLQVNYKDKLKEDEKRNKDNWNDHFDKLKTTYEKEQESNDIDDLLKYADKQSQDENLAANNKYTQKSYPGQHHRPHYRFPRKFGHLTFCQEFLFSLMYGTLPAVFCANCYVCNVLLKSCKMFVAFIVLYF